MSLANTSVLLLKMFCNRLKKRRCLSSPFLLLVGVVVWLIAYPLIYLPEFLFLPETTWKGAEIGAGILSEVVVDRNVSFLSGDDMMQFRLNDHYSGMWWVSRELFDNSDWTSRTCLSGNYEGASFRMFNTIGLGNVYMTRDWLDFSVEHLSHYFKAINTGQRANFEILVEQQRRYLKLVTTRFSNGHDSAFNSTIAILPFFSSNDDDFVPNLTLEDVPSKARQKYMYMYSLSATLASLWQVGIGRVVVPGNLVHEPVEVREAIEIFQRHCASKDSATTSMEVVYVPMFADLDNLPCSSVNQLKMAFDGTMTEAERQLQWVGPDSKRWKFIYFSEPDLILHTRPASLQALSRVVEAGKMLSAHRLQLLPSEVDFPQDYESNANEYLPAYGNFSSLTDLDVQAGDVCCDAGNWWPGFDDYLSCGNWWYLCGYGGPKQTMTRKERYDKHVRLFNYPSIRIVNGMHVYVIHEHARVCLPKKDGNCDDWESLVGHSKPN